MKYLILLLLFISTFGYSQTNQTDQTVAEDDEDVTFVLPVHINNPSGSYPNFTATLSTVVPSALTNDFTNYLFNINQIQLNYIVINGQGSIFRIISRTPNGADLDVSLEELTSNSGGFFSSLPATMGVVSVEEEHCGLLNVAAIGNTGIDPIVQAAVINYNKERTGNCINNALSNVTNNTVIRGCGIPTGPVPDGNEVFIDTCLTTDNNVYHVALNNYVPSNFNYVLKNRWAYNVDSSAVFELQDSIIDGIVLSIDTIFSICNGCMNNSLTQEKVISTLTDTSQLICDSLFSSGSFVGVTCDTFYIQDIQHIYEYIGFRQGLDTCTVQITKSGNGNEIRRDTIDCDPYYANCDSIPSMLIDLAGNGNYTFKNVILNGNPVTWTNLTSSIITDTSIILSATGSGWNQSGAESKQKLVLDGYVEFQDGGGVQGALGFSVENPNNHYNTIDYTIYLNSNNTVSVFENGVHRGELSTHSVGDIFRVEREGFVISYKRNGTTFYNSTIPSGIRTIATIQEIAENACLNKNRIEALEDIDVSNFVEKEYLENFVEIPMCSGFDGTQYFSETAKGDKVDIMFIGDSNTENEYRFIEPLRDLFATKYGGGGFGWVSARDTWNAAGNSITHAYTGTWVTNVVGTNALDLYEQTLSAGDGVNISFDGAREASNCDVIEIHYNDVTGGNQFTYDITNPSIVNTTASVTTVAGYNVVTIPVEYGLHNFDFLVDVGSIEILGFNFTTTENNQKVVVHKIGHSGTRTTDYAPAASIWDAQLTNIDADVVFINLGTNDYPTYKNSLETIIQRVQSALPNADVVILSPPDGNNRSASIYDEFKKEYFRLSKKYETGFMSLYELIGNFSQADENSLMDDNVHLSRIAGSVIEKAINDCFFNAEISDFEEDDNITTATLIEDAQGELTGKVTLNLTNSIESYAFQRIQEGSHFQGFTTEQYIHIKTNLTANSVTGNRGIVVEVIGGSSSFGILRATVFNRFSGITLSVDDFESNQANVTATSYVSSDSKICIVLWHNSGFGFRYSRLHFNTYGHPDITACRITETKSAASDVADRY